MDSTVGHRHSLKTRITLGTLAIFLFGIWSLSLYASHILREDMERLLGEQQFSTISLVASEINDELENLKVSLPRAARLLLPGARLVVISFQSHEDELVKQFGRDAQPAIIAVNKKPLLPSDEEVLRNPRSRSAKMRIFEHV